MSFTLQNITLPEGLRWADKYDWTPVAQKVDVLLYGTLSIEEAAQSAGRTITLLGGRDRCWTTRAVVDQLYALMQTAGAEMTLNLAGDGSHTVIWSRQSNPISAKPLLEYNETTADDIFIIDQLNFLEI